MSLRFTVWEAPTVKRSKKKIPMQGIKPSSMKGIAFVAEILNITFWGGVYVFFHKSIGRPFSNRNWCANTTLGGRYPERIPLLSETLQGHLSG